MSARPLLRRGDKGSPVVELQLRLLELGYELERYGADGGFGDETFDAVTQFQMAEGLDPIDGVVGPDTWKALDAGTWKADSETRFVMPSDDTVAALAVRAAFEDLGKREIPNGSNEGVELVEIVRGYREHIRSSQEKAPSWCGLAVCVWTARALGLGHASSSIDWKSHPFRYWRGSTVSNSVKFSLLQWAMANDRLLPADGPAPVGSIFLMITRTGSGSDAADGEKKRAIGHCGLVVADHGDEIESIDGNVSNRVKRCNRTKASLHGYVVWW